MKRTIRAENSIPNAGGDAEIVIPHAPLVVKVVYRLALPKAALGVCVLKLVGVSRKRRVQQGARRKSDPHLDRVQETGRDERPRTARIAEKLAQKAVTMRVSVMLNVLFALQPKMHHAVSPILGEGTHDECQERCAEPEGHVESVTPCPRPRQSKVARGLRIRFERPSLRCTRLEILTRRSARATAR